MRVILPVGSRLRRLLPVLLPVLLPGLLLSGPLFAQQPGPRLTLARLFVLSEPASAQGHNPDQDFNDWTFKPATAQAALEPLTWAWWPTSAQPEPDEEPVPAVAPLISAVPAGQPAVDSVDSVDAVIARIQPPTLSGPEPVRDSRGLPPLQLSLRPLAKGYDVVLFVRRLAVFNQLHRELDRQRLEAVSVTCIGPKCLGERFTTASGTVAFYQGKAGDYPYIIVLHPLSGPGLRTVRVSGPAGAAKPAAPPLTLPLPSPAPPSPASPVRDSLGSSPAGLRPE